ncbi:diphthamide synthesis DPH2 family protein [Wolffia australiana]
MDFAACYEIDRTAEFIRSRGYKRVALQFPDEFLADATRVAKALRTEFEKEVAFYVMADTAYGSCCVDEVAASHVDADCVVHYGHACCSPTSTLPALFVFRKMPIDVDVCAESLFRFLTTSEKPILVLYGLEFAYVLESIEKEVANKLSDCCVTIPEPIFADISCFNVDPPDTHSRDISNTVESNGREKSYCLGGLTWSLPADRTMEQYLLVWIGSESSAFTNAMLMFNGCEAARYDPEENCLVREGNLHGKVLNRRYYLVERAKDANIVGILVGTLGIAGYLHIVEKMKTLIEGAGKKTYILVMGRPNAVKLANFPECDVFVYVSCAQTALLDSKEFLSPVITPFEAMLAFQRGRQWTGEYDIDFRSLMHLNETKLPQCNEEEDEARFSFFQGGYVEDTGKTDYGDTSENKAVALAELTQKALTLSKEDADSVLFKGRAQSAAEYLAARSYTGLDTCHDNSLPQTIVPGRTGRAAGYDHEK